MLQSLPLGSLKLAAEQPFCVCQFQALLRQSLQTSLEMTRIGGQKI